MSLIVYVYVLHTRPIYWYRGLDVPNTQQKTWFQVCSKWGRLALGKNVLQRGGLQAAGDVNRLLSRDNVVTGEEWPTVFLPLISH